MQLTFSFSSPEFWILAGLLVWNLLSKRGQSDQQAVLVGSSRIVEVLENIDKKLAVFLIRAVDTDNPNGFLREWKEIKKKIEQEGIE